MDRDLYEVLGVSKGASADDLKKAHRTLVRKFHPDVNKDPGADARFKEIQEAYDVLSDPEKRRLYDQFGIAGVKAGAGGGPGPRPGADPFGGAGPFGGGGQSWQNVDPSTFEEVFGSVFGRAARGRGRGGFGGFGGADEDEDERPRHGRNAEASETIDFLTSVLGGTRTFRVDGESIEVRIPAGIKDGARLAVRGKGGRGSAGGPAGDLIIAVTVTPHPWFRREGDDILTDVPLTIAEAALGTTVRVPLLQGSVQLKVPPGVKGGQRLRVKGKGIQPPKGAPGDFLAVVQVDGPRDLDAQSRALVEQLAPRLANPRTGPQWES